MTDVLRFAPRHLRRNAQDLLELQLGNHAFESVRKNIPINGDNSSFGDHAQFGWAEPDREVPLLALDGAPQQVDCSWLRQARFR